MLASSWPDPLLRAVVFDGDDTLWRTEQLYDDARSRARKIVVDAGINGAEWEKLERQIDVQNVASLGFSLNRFPTSCVQAYEELCRRRETQVDPSVSHRVREAAVTVFASYPPLVPGAIDMLVTLRTRGLRLALLTKGVAELQFRRIEASGLKNYFDVVKVVNEKTPDAIREVLSMLGVRPESAWMVGNSMRSDILPALELHMRVIWIKSHTWEYERAFDHMINSSVMVVHSLEQIPELILKQR